jgi:hypothetical protein
MNANAPTVCSRRTPSVFVAVPAPVAGMLVATPSFATGKKINTCPAGEGVTK